ncbi:MAG: nucleoside kinase [Clostridia bacterium]|nr:nucleoside kinase [Clostridia bacterium]
MRITYEEKIFESSQPIKVNELLKDDINEKHIACIVNNQVHALDYEIREDSKIELLDTSTKEGRSVYIRGIMFVMGKAFADCYPKALLSVNYQLHNSMFCQIDNMKVTTEMIDKVRERMKQIIKADLPITKTVMSLEEAKAFYAHSKNANGRFQINNHAKEISLYFCGDYYNYLYGPMPLSTGIVKYFEIEKYKDGYLVRYPDKTKPYEMGEYKETKKLLATFDEYDDIYRLLNVNTVHKLNKKVENGEINDFILLSEALHEKKISILADKIARKSNVKMVLIAGPSSSGKTTFARKLSLGLRLKGIKPVTISVDNYFVERKDNPKDEFGNYDFECIEAIDLKLFNEHLVKLLNGETIEVPKFDFKVGTKCYDGTTMSLAKDEILVIEGIHCLNDRLTQAIPKDEKVKIYISDLTVLNIDYFNRISTTDTRLIRRIVRDYKYRGYDALSTLKSWYSVNRGEEKYIYPYQEEADYMFNSSLIYELAAEKKYAVPLLKEIDNTHKEYGEAQRLIKFLEYFDDIPDDDIPNTSLLREFIGGSIYHKETKKK